MKIRYNFKTIYKFNLDEELHNKSIHFLLDELKEYIIKESPIDLLVDLNIDNMIFINKGLILDMDKTFLDYKLTNDDSIILIENKYKTKKDPKKYKDYNAIFDSILNNLNIPNQEIYTNGNSFANLLNNYISENTPVFNLNSNQINETNENQNQNNNNNNITTQVINLDTIVVNNNNDNNDNNNDNNDNNDNKDNNDNNKYQEQLNELNTMGFYDNNYNLQLLQLFNGDINQVIGSLC